MENCEEIDDGYTAGGFICFDKAYREEILTKIIMYYVFSNNIEEVSEIENRLETILNIYILTRERNDKPKIPIITIENKKKTIDVNDIDDNVIKIDLTEFIDENEPDIVTKINVFKKQIKFKKFTIELNEKIESGGFKEYVIERINDNEEKCKELKESYEKDSNKNELFKTVEKDFEFVYKSIMDIATTWVTYILPVPSDSSSLVYRKVSNTLLGLLPDEYSLIISNISPSSEQTMYDKINLSGKKFAKNMDIIPQIIYHMIFNIVTPDDVLRYRLLYLETHGKKKISKIKE